MSKTDGTCAPPAGETHNTSSQQVDGGAVQYWVTWDWDGVTVPPNCDGPVVSIRAVNTTAVSYYAHLPRKARGSTVVQIPPNSDSTITGNALRQAGLDTYSATLDLVVDRNAT